MSPYARDLQSTLIEFGLRLQDMSLATMRQPARVKCLKACVSRRVKLETLTYNVQGQNGCLGENGRAFLNVERDHGFSVLFQRHLLSIEPSYSVCL